MAELDGHLPDDLADGDGVSKTFPLVVVGIGASSASVGSLTDLVETLDIAARIAVVIVVNQRENLDEAGLRAGVASKKGLTIREPVDGMEVQAGAIYLAPADLIVTLTGNRIATRPVDQRPGERAGLDSFFVSLAETAQDMAIGVILRGTDSDGSLGVTAIREHGGLTIVEDQGTDTAEVLAHGTRPAALADFVLPASAISERISLYARRILALRDTVRLEDETPELALALSRIVGLLRNATGHDFHGYKRKTFLRRVERRMQVVGADTIEDYVAALRADPDEPQRLFNDLLIGVTQFFRDGKEFELLEREVIPRLCEGKGPSDQIRVWVLGCATGEEAYSIGILLREYMVAHDIVAQAQIFATDIDGRALAAARTGRYPESIRRDVSPERLTRWFVREGNTYRVAKEVRDMCIFSGHSLVRDAPFSRIDLVSCRNLLIYLNAELQARVIPIFHFSLRPNGHLFLGTSENISRHAKLFAPIDRRARIFRRLETPTRVMPDFPLGATSASNTAERIIGEGRAARIEKLTRRAEQAAERHAPAFVVVDEFDEVLHFSGRTGRYIDPPSGVASLNVINLVHRDLRLDLRTALSKAKTARTAIRTAPLPLDDDGNRLVVEIIVEVLRSGPQEPKLYIVVFKDGVSLPADAYDRETSTALARDEHVRGLENELRGSRERLQTTIEELESTNEEIKSSNEEYQSLNEELQSANEELETSKEELQSVNEELTTVNGELAQRVSDLARINNDLKNFLESTQIATVFVDNELRVMNYTPAVTEIFPLMESDLGRPINNIKSLIPLDHLQDDMRRVIRTLGTVEREVDDLHAGTRFIVRVLPYRSIDNFIAGAVVTFVDITTLTRAEGALRESEKRFRDLADFSPDGILIYADGRFVYANRAASELLGAASPEAVCRLSPSDIIQPSAYSQTFMRLTQVENASPNVSTELGLMRLDGSALVVETSTGPIMWGGRPAVQLLLRDVGDRKRAEEGRRLLQAELQHRVRNTLAVLRSIARRTAETADSVEDYAMHLDGRINAFSRVQSVVTRNPAAGIDLAHLVADELLAYAAHEGGQAQIEGPPLRLQPKAAETFGLALHELTTNAVKYGALSHSAGRIAVTWRVDAGATPPHLVFSWKESGPFESPKLPLRRGFGTELLESTLAYELKAQTSRMFDVDGIAWTIALPLTEKVIVKGNAAANDDSLSEGQRHDRT